MINLVVGKPLPHHRDYFDDKLARDFYKASYIGGYKYKNSVDCTGEPVFIEHENESSKGVTRRKRISNYNNYCSMVIDRYNNFIFSNTIRRDGSEAFKLAQKNVDLNGTNWEDFIKATEKKAQIEGKALFQIESTKTLDQAEQTVLQSELSGNKLFVISIDSDNVLNWAMCNNAYKELLVSYPDENRFCLYSCSSYQSGTVDPDSNLVLTIDVPQDHDFGCLPFVCCTAFDHGLSQLRDVAESNMCEFNLSSLLMEELTGHTFTQSFISGWSPKTPDGKKNFDTIAFSGKKFIVLKSDPDAKIIPTLSTEGAETSQAESLQKVIDSVRDNIYRQSGLSDLGHDSMGQRSSGNSLKIKLNDMTLMAASISLHAEKAENKWIEIQNKFNNSFEMSVYPTVDELDIEAFGDELEATLKIIGSPEMPQVLKKEQLKSFQKMVYPRMDSQTKIDLEIELETGIVPDDSDNDVEGDVEGEGNPTPEMGGGIGAQDRDDNGKPIPISKI